jgi:magnesium chelatase subunit D
MKSASINPRRGRYARSVGSKALSSKIAVDATLRALLVLRSQDSPSPSAKPISRLTPVSPDALRYKLFKQKRGTLFIFAIDTSGSMALNRIARAKDAILKLLRQSYLNRDSVAIVTFRGKSASVSLSPSRSILRARRVLDSLSMGGSTPLSAGLLCSLDLVKQVRDKHGQIAMLLFTDGHANVSLRENGNGERALRQQLIESEIAQIGATLKKVRVSLTLVDTQSGFVSDDDSRRVAEVLGADFIRLR